MQIDNYGFEELTESVEAMEFLRAWIGGGLVNSISRKKKATGFEEEWRSVIQIS